MYFHPVELKEANEDLAGNLMGSAWNLCVQCTVNVGYVVPGGPSDKAGLDRRQIINVTILLIIKDIER